MSSSAVYATGCGGCEERTASCVLDPHRLEFIIAAAPDEGAWAELENVLGQLPAEQREAIVLKYADDLTYEEMSRITGAGESALKMRVQRAFARLRALLQEVPSV